ncbi:MAG: FAD assembly factor SdhE [Candidatus Arsenophonus melophagi]|nr:FAD assembly factor SdhE [Candidatus Arsenophonus melophagi]
MDFNHKSKIKWSCRRGMRELDIAIIPFFEYEYDSLTVYEKCLFVRLLEYEDYVLCNWLMNHGRPNDDGLYHIIQLIQSKINRVKK